MNGPFRRARSFTVQSDCVGKLPPLLLLARVPLSHDQSARVLARLDAARRSGHDFVVDENFDCYQMLDGKWSALRRSEDVPQKPGSPW